MCVRLFIIGAWCIICNATGVRVLPCSFDLIHILMYFSYQLKRISSYWAIDYIYLWLLFFFSFHITWLCDVCVCMWMRIYMSVSIYKYYMWVPPVNECVCVNYLPQTKQIYFAMFVFRSQRQVSPINYIAITNKVHFEFVILPILVQTKKTSLYSHSNCSVFDMSMQLWMLRSFWSMYNFHLYILNFWIKQATISINNWYRIGARDGNVKFIVAPLSYGGFQYSFATIWWIHRIIDWWSLILQASIAIFPIESTAVRWMWISGSPFE